MGSASASIPVRVADASTSSCATALDIVENTEKLQMAGAYLEGCWIQE